MPMSAQYASHNENSCVVPHFGYPDTRNAVVALMIPLALHDADGGTSGITWPQSSCTSFWSSWLSNGMVALMTLLASCDTPASMVSHDQKLCCTLFQLTCPNDYNATIDNAIGITWCWCQYQQCKMAEKVLLNLILSYWNNKCNSAIDDVISIMWWQESCCTLFQSSWPHKQNGAIDNAISVMKCSHCYEQHYLTKSVTWHLVSVTHMKFREKPGNFISLSNIGQSDLHITYYGLLHVWYTPGGNMCRVCYPTSKESNCTLSGSCWPILSTGVLIRSCWPT